MKKNTSLGQLLSILEQDYSPFYKTVASVAAEKKDLFEEFGIFSCDSAVKAFGHQILAKIARGYVYFVTDVNKEQIKYCSRGHYKNKTYKEVYDSVYNNDEYMEFYHWGVFATTFCWKHHLEIYEFFKTRFLQKYAKDCQTMVDFGSGSGIWSLSSARFLEEVQITAIDVSKSSLKIAESLAMGSNLAERISFKVGDALSFHAEDKFSAGVSCFLLEHLENPGKLLKNLSDNLAPGAPCFVTGAVTAAEIDHIFEFKSEAELVELAEKSGFRVCEIFSGFPDSFSHSMRFMPRSLAMILKKKHTETW